MNIEHVLNELNISHNIKHFIPSDITKIDGDTLYYKNIPSGLLAVNHYTHFDQMLPDDGFKVKGTMVDLSRNAVFQLDYFKTVIKRKALLGFNEIWLYMEDVYELKDYPKFGYLRGKYKLEELQALDAYATSLGVTLIPCIQTLGHMGQFLRWSSNAHLSDQKDVLLVTTSDDFIDAMINFSKQAFKTNRIHVGMDETFGFSFGNYYKKHGYKNPEALFMAHLNQVNSICLKHGYVDVFIWSDMFFRHRSKTNYYYDYTISFDDDMVNQIPANVGLVYWDYYNKDVEIYSKMLEKHLQMNRKVIMASGTWIWTKLAYDQKKTLQTASCAIEASKKLGLNEIIFTQWQDDGAYVDYETSFLGLYDVSNIMHNQKLNPDYLNHVTTLSFKEMKCASDINDYGYYPVQLLWDDLLLGIYLNDLVGYDYQKLNLPIRKTNRHIRILKTMNLDHHMLLAEVLKYKLQIRQSMLKAYFTNGDFNVTIRLVKRFKTKIRAFLASTENMWHERYRAFGLEVLQNRLFAQIRRADEALYWIDAYTNGSTKTIPFLEEVISKEGYLPVKHIDLAFSSKQ